MSEKIKNVKQFGFKMISKVVLGIYGLGVVVSSIWFGETVMNTVTDLMPAVVNFFGKTIVSIAIEYFGYILLIYSMSSLCWDFRKEDDKLKFWTSTITLSCCIFIYTVFRIVKNSLAVPSLGPEGTSLGKLVVGVTSVIYGLYMGWLNKKFHIKRLLPGLIIPSSAYFAFFFIVLMKMGYYSYVLPPQSFIDWWQQSFINRAINYQVIAAWPKFIFYVVSETLALPLLTAGYQVFNLNVNKKSSKRLLIPLLIVSQFVTMTAGFIFETTGGSTTVTYIDQYVKDVKIGNKTPSPELQSTVGGAFDTTVTQEEDGGYLANIGFIVVIVSTIVLTVANGILFSTYDDSHHPQHVKSDKKPKISLSSAAQLMWENKIILAFTIIPILYAVCSSFIEQCWQASLKKVSEGIIYHYYGDEIKNLKTALGASGEFKTRFDNIKQAVYSPLYSNYIINQGRATMLLIIGTTRILSNHLSWLSFSLILPVVLGILSLIFFGIIVFGGGSNGMIFGSPVLPLIMTFGTISLLFTKSAKISMSDYTMESAASAQSQEDQKNIKICSSIFGRMGKTFTSVVLYLITNTCGFSLLGTVVGISLIIFIVAAEFGWIKSLFFISEDLKKHAEQEELQNKSEPQTDTKA